MLWSDRDDAEAVGLGAAHGAGRTTVGADEAADAGGAAVHQKTVAPVHTVPRAGFGDKDNAVGLGEDMPVARLIRLGPTPGLVLTGEDPVQLDFAVEDY